MKNPLRQFFDNPEHRKMHKWDHYFNIYHRHFKHLLGQRPIHLLEIGVSKGGSIEMWINYFGKDNCVIYGIDINKKCKGLENFYQNVKIFIGDQADKNFLRSVSNQIPPLDIIIDDGGHTMIQQINTFEILYDHVKPGGIYLCEDTHTSYWQQFGGGYKNPKSFIEYIKNYIDKLNAYHSTDKSLTVDNYTKSINSIHFYDSIVLIEKHITTRPKPIAIITGKYDI